MKMEEDFDTQVRALQIAVAGMVCGLATLLPQNMPLSQAVMPTASPEVVATFLARCNALGSVTEFILNPLLGSLGDNIGRKPILLGAFATTSVLRAITYLRNDSLFLVGANHIISRGLDTVIFTTARAGLNDMMTGQALAEAIPKIAVAAGLSVIIGPGVSLGITRLTGSHTLPLALAAGVSLASFTVVSTKFKETVMDDKRKAFLWKSASPLAFLEVLTSSSTIAKLMTTSQIQTMVDGRNMADTDFAFQQSELGWTTDDSGKFVVAAGVKILLGGIIGKKLVSTLGLRGIGTFSNVFNAITMGLFLVAPRYSFYHIFLSMFGDRKRDGIEAMVSDLGVKKGFGKGQISAALSNWRSIANIVAPLIFAAALNSGIRLKNRTGNKAMAGLHYMVAALISILAEIVYRTISKAELDAQAVGIK